MSYVLGIDLDNTIINYDPLLHKLALKEGIISQNVNIRKSKKHIRDHIRKLRAGELKWRRIQALAYGKEIEKVELSPEVKEFFKLCREYRIKVYIISHKTEFPAYKKYNVNLRKAALKWMNKNKFFQKSGLGISKKDVYFESTQEDKIKRIKKLGCTHFIDDLEETFLHEDFPQRIHKILYNRKGSRKLRGKAMRFQTWNDISQYLFNAKKLDVRKISSEMLMSKVIEAEQLKGGRNGIVYRVRTERGKDYALKLYLQISDRRDRLKAEYEALSFMWANGIRDIPKPVAFDRKNNCTVYGYVAGRKIEPAEVTKSDVRFLCQFLRNLKAIRDKPGSKRLGNASEASFSPEMMVAHIKKRLVKLKNVPHSTREQREMHSFVEKKYTPAFKKIAGSARLSYQRTGHLFSKRLEKKYRTLSPSDFGFHNSLRTRTGITLLDFEYFGWDDPAKMICDFLIHPAMTLKKALKRQFLNEVMDVFKDDQGIADRIKAYYPLCGLNWCLIILNEFLYNQMLRRKLASRDRLLIGKIRQKQLLKAKKLLGKLIKWRRNPPLLGIKHGS